MCVRFIVLVLFAVASSVFAQSANPKQQLKRNAEWEVLYKEGITADEYAKELDYFDIEIGTVGKDGKIQYAKKFSQSKPEKRIGKQDLENRLGVGWKRGTLHALDRKVLARAGISTQDKEILHYYTNDLKDQLFKIELAYGNHAMEEIKRTRFEVRPKSNGEKGYEFVVIEQDLIEDSNHPRPGTTRSPGSTTNRQ